MQRFWIKKAGLLLLSPVITTLLLIDPAFANPVLSGVTSGSATVTQTTNTTVVNQTSQNTIINWNSFNIGAGQATHFQQPSGGVALNRINPTQGVAKIFGTLTATGTIILVDGAGIYFGPNASVNVGSLIASTSGISNANFLSGNYIFDKPSAYAGSIINKGHIQAADYGLVALLGTAIQNDGTIKARLGSVTLGAGSEFTLDFYGDQLVNFAVDAPASSAGVGPNGKALKYGIENNGAIIADGGTIYVTAQTAKQVLTHSIDMNGIVQANSVQSHNGTIIFSAGAGTIALSGKVSAKGLHGQHGGTIEVLGNNVNIKSSAVLNASGSTGGGEILIGGNSGGESPLQNAVTTTIAAGAMISANAITNGNGGNISVYSSADTIFDGNIYATGGSQSGNGGTVEVSGSNLGFNGVVNTSAANGSLGTLLLDPQFLIIETTGGSSYSAGNNNLFANNIGSTNIITPASIIASDTNIALQANTDVIFNSALALTASDGTLTVDAGRSIILNADVSTTNQAISLIANDSSATSTDRLTTSTGNPSGDTETVNGDIILASGVTLSSGTAATTLTIGSSTTAPFSPGSITQGATGGITAGTLNITVPTASSGSIGTSNDPLLTTTTGTVTLTTGSGGAYIENTGSFTLADPTLSTNSPLFVTSSGALTLAPSTAISTGTGNLTLESLGGSLTTTGNLTTSGGNILLSSSTAMSIANALNAGAGTVTLDANTGGTGANNFSMTGSITDTNTTSGAVVIDVNAAGGGTGTATLANITTGSGGTISIATNTGSNTTGGSITQTASTLLTAGNITLDVPTASSSGIGTSGTPILTSSSGGTLTITAGSGGAFVSNTGSLTLATPTLATNSALSVISSGTLTLPAAAISTGTGNLTLESLGGTLTTAGTLTTSGGNILLSSSTAMTISNALNAGAGTVTLDANAGGTGANNFSMTASITDTNTTASAVVIDVNAAGGGTGSAALANITTGSGGTINIATNTGSNTTGGSITQTASTLLTAGNIILDVPTASSSGIGASGTPILTSSSGGTLTITAGSGGAFVSNTGSLTLATPTLATNSALSVISSGTLTLPAAAISTGTGNLILESLGGALTNAGTLTTSGGNILLSSSTAMTIANALNAGAGTITLDANTGGTGANNFTMTGESLTDTNTTANAVTINVNNTAGGTGTAALGNITTGAGGTITVATNFGGNTTGGSITQAASTLLNSGTTGSVILSTGAAAAGIGTSAANILTTTETIAATTGTGGGGTGGLYLTDSQALNLGTTTTTGLLSVTAGGSITQSGVLTVTGTSSTFAVTAASSDILLNTQANSLTNILFSGTESNIRDFGYENTSASASSTLPSTLLPLTGLHNLSIDFTNSAVILPEESLSGNLSVISGGSVTQTGQIVAPGTTSITAGANPITLTLANNILSGAVSLSNSGANNVAITTNSALVLGNVAVGTGTLALDSTGTISQQVSTAITQTTGAGAATFSSLGGLTLNNSSNSLVSFNETNLLTGNVSLTNTAATLTLGTITSTGGGNIIVNNTGNMTSSGVVTSGNNGAITLTASGVETISGVITSVGSGAVTLTGTGGINLGANITGGGNIIFNNAVTLTSNPTLNSGVGNITFASTLDGAFPLTLTSAGTVTLTGAVGSITPLTGLTTTANAPGVTVIDSNVTTAGPQSYGNPITLDGTSTFQATGGNSITITGGVTWGGAYTLSLNAASLALNGAMNGSSGTLNLSAAISGTPDITATGSVSVANFNLQQGYWSQTSSLPGFSVSNNFQINSGVIPTTNAEFLRVAGGSGTSGSPYQITDIYGLEGVASATSLFSDYYVLNDSFTASTANWNSNAGFLPIGSSSNPFTGSLNGQGNTISGLTIDSSATTDIGLFGEIGSSASVTNLNVTNASVTSTATSANNIGIIAGLNNGTMTSDSVSGAVIASGNSASNVGAIVGENDGSLTASYSYANVSTTGSSSSNIGGLVGANEGSDGYINTSYSAGTVDAGTSAGDIGGLVGYEDSTYSTNPPIQNTYSISTVTASGATDVGGLVGDEVSGPIATSYSSGVVPVSGTHVGGFVGSTSISTNSDDFFDTGSSGTSTGVGSGSTSGVTAGCFSGGACANGGSATLSSFSTFNSAGWNIVAGPSAGTTPPSGIWYILSGSTRPMLAMEWSTTITNAHQAELMNFALGASYTLGGNVDLSAASVTGNAADVWGGSANPQGFLPVGSTANNFTGSFTGTLGSVGNNYALNNLTIDTSSTTGTGLFGATSSAATLTDISLTNVNITNSATSATPISIDVGALVGLNQGTITNGDASGSITISGNEVSDIGGLVGQNTGTITATMLNFSSSTVTLSSSGNLVSNLGDFAGLNTGTISMAYATGTISSSGNTSSNVGGFVGDNQGGVSSVFASGNVTVSGSLPSSIGGLAGTNGGSGGYISASYSTGTIAATDALTTATDIGGLVGSENSSYSTTSPILNTYSTSLINIAGGGTDVGGLVGDQTSGSIGNSLSIGASTITGTKVDVGGFIGASTLSSNTADFYDTTTSGTGTSVGSGSSTGITQGCLAGGTCPNGGTANLSLISTFTGAGWDFTTPVWEQFNGYSYPYISSLTLGIQVTDTVAGGVAPTVATNGNVITPTQIIDEPGSNYEYFLSKTVLSGNPILFYNTNISTGSVGNAIVIPPTGALVPLSITITSDTIQVGGSNTGTISSGSFSGSASGGSDILYSSGSTLVLGNATNPNVTLQTSATTTLNINGAVSSTGSDDVMTIDGATTINNGGSIISTTGNQTYTGNITMSSAADLTTTTGGNITVNGNIATGTNTLTINNSGAGSAMNGVISGSGGLTLQGTGTLILADNNTYSGTTSVSSGTLELNSTGATPTPLGSGTVSLAGGTLMAGTALTGPVANPFDIVAIGIVSSIGGSNNLTLSGSGTITSPYTLNVTNTATTTLSDSFLTSTGPINALGGTLVISGANNSLYSGTTTLSDGATLEVGAATNALGTGALVLNQGSFESLVPSATIANATTVNGAVSIIGANNSTFSGPITLYGGNLTDTDTGTTTLSGNLLAGAGSLTQNSVGGTLIVSGANSAYLGATTITSGTLAVDSATNALGTGTGDSLILNGGVLESTYTSGTATLGNKFVVGGSGTATIGGVNNLTLSNNATLNNVLNDTDTGTVTLSGTLAGSTSGTIVENASGGTMIISGTNTYGPTSSSTGTTVTAGTLVAENSKALSAGKVVVTSGGELALNGNGSNITIANAISLAGSGVSSAGALTDIDTSNTDVNAVSGAVTLTGAATIGVASSTTQAFALSGGITNAGFTTTFNPALAGNAITESGVITGTGGVTINGGLGTLTLSATNTFSGSNTVSSGTVVVSNNQGLGVSNMTTINSGGTVKVSSSDLVATEAFTLNSGTLEAGMATAGVAGAITLAEGSADTVSPFTSGTFTLGGTINGTSGVDNGDLTFSNTGGTIALSSIVGGTTPINTLTDSSTLTLGTSTTAITSVGNQTYNGSVTASATTTTLKTTGTGNISITNTMAAGAHSLTLISGGAVSESGSGKITSTGTVTTTSATGTTLGGANTISTFGATDASTTGIALTNTAAPLTLNAITETDGGLINISNTGAISDTGTIQDSGGTDSITLTSTGAISQAGYINGGVLTTSSAGGTVLGGANTVTSFNATNITSGNISLTNTAAPLDITGISQSGGGTTSVTNTGAMNVNGTVTGGAGTVTLSATGLLTANDGISTTNKAISLSGAGITVAASTSVSAGSGNITATVASGDTLTLNSASHLSSTGTVTLSADNMAFNTSGTPSQIGGAGADVILQSTTSGTTIGIAGATGSLQLTAAVLNDITATKVRIGNSSAGAITIGAWTPDSGFLATNGVLTLDTAGTITETGAMNLTTNSSVGLILRGASSVNLSTSENDFANLASTGISGTLNVNVNNAVSVASLTDDLGTVNGVTATGGVTLNANSNGITLNSGAGVTANATGNSIVLAGSMFTNNDGSSALNPGTGNFLVWSGNPANDNLDGITNYSFRQYDATYGVTTPAQSASNGFLYTIAPVITPELVGTVVKVYDTTDAATLTASNYSETGSIDGDTITFNNPTSGTYSQSAAGGPTLNVAVTGISITSTTNGSIAIYGYQLGSTSANANIGTIEPAQLNIVGLAAENKVYDTTTNATLSDEGTLSGIIGSDNVSLNYTGVTASFATPNVGNGITVTASGYVLTGTNASDYTLNPASLMTTANITPAPLTVTGVTANNKVYDSTTTATLNTGSAVLSGVYASDDANVSLNGGAGTFASANVANGIAVTTNTIVLTGSASGNYYVTPLPMGLTANITPATLTYVANTATSVYGSSIAATSGSVTGFVGGQTLSDATTGTLAFSTTATSSSNTGTYGITGSGLTADNGNYVFVQAGNNSTAYTITAATLTYTTTDASMTYGGTVPTLTGTVTGFVNGQSVSTATTGTASFTTTATDLSNVGTYAGDGSGLTADNGNYIFVQASGNSTALTINPATLTYNTTAANSTYGSTPVLTGTVTGFVNGQSVSSATTGTASFTTTATALSNVGTYATTGSGLTADNGNYTFVQASGNSTALTINPATLTYVTTAANSTYGSTPVLTGTVTGFVNGQSVSSATTGTASFTTLATALSNVGTYATTGSGLTADNGNYTFVQASGNSTALTINPATLTYTTNAATSTYGSTPVLTGTVTGFVNGQSVGTATTGTASFTTTATALSNVGTYATSGSGLTADNGNYTFVQASGNSTALTINPATLTYTTNAATSTYGSTPVLTGTVTGFVNGQSVSSATTGTASFTTTATALSNVGTYATTGSGLTADNGNYTFVQASGNSTALTINPATLTYTTNAATSIYGSTPVLTGTVTGFVNGQSVGTATTGTASFTTTATALSNVGTYATTGSGLTADNGNYTFVQASGNSTALTINPATLTYTTSTATSTYGSTPVLTGTVTGFVNGQSVGTATTGTASFTTTATALSNVGTYATTGSGLTADNGNYTFVQASGNSTALTINPATLTYTTNTATSTYGNTPVLTGTVMGFVNGQSVGTATTGTASFTTTATALSNVGTYATTGSGLTADNGNYTFVQASGNSTALTINPATLTYTTNTATSIYGSTPVLTGTVTGFVNGQSVGTATTGTASFTTTATDLSNVGTYATSGSGLTADNGNYTFVQASGNSTALTINPATLTYTTNAATSTYGSTPVLTGTVTGFVNGQSVGTATTGTASFTTPATALSNVGTYATSGSGLTADNGNYTFVQASGNSTALTINPATLTYTTNAATSTYGSTPVLTGTVTGFVNGQSISSATTGTASFTTPATALSNVGTYATTGSGLTADNGNYTFVQASGNSTALTINPATLTYTTNTATSTYGSTPVLTGTVTGFVNGQSVSSATTGTASFTTPATALSNVGTYATTGSGLTADNGNYTFVQASGNSTALTINPAILTYTTTPSTTTYGTTPVLTGTVTGFVNGQTITTATTGTASFTTPATALSNVGTYTSDGSGLTADNGNYTFVQAASNTTDVTINPATLTYTTTPSSMIYGGIVPTLTGLVTGFVNGQTIATATTGTTSFTTTATSTSNVGTYAGDGSGLTANNGNYIFTQATSNATAVTINPATLIYTTTPSSMTYGGTVPILTGSVTGFVNGQTIATATTGTASFTTTATSTSNVGTYAGDGSGLAANNGNYTFEQAAGNATAVTINPASLTINGIIANNKTYDGTTTATLNLGSVVISGILNGDSVALNSSSYNANFVTSNVGNNIQVLVTGLGLAGLGASNYVISEINTPYADIFPTANPITPVVTANTVLGPTTSPSNIISSFVFPVQFSSSTPTNTSTPDTNNVNIVQNVTSIPGESTSNCKAISYNPPVYICQTETEH